MIDIEKIRAETPACENIIHFNNAGAALMPEPVFAALISHLELERDIGGYAAAERASEELHAFYTEFAALLNAEPDEIAYVENATRAWDMAFYGLQLQAGDRVLTHASEYASNFLALLQQSKRLGFAIDVAPSDASGQLDVAAMEAMITPRTRLIAITHVPSQGGLVNPAAAVGAVARKHNLVYLLDACQSAGQIDLDVQEIGCQILAGTGRKFLRGPRGTGFLYVAKHLHNDIEPPFIDLHSAEWTGLDSYEWAPGARRFETWESFVAGKISLARAVRYAREIGLPAIQQRVTDLAASLRRELADVPGITVRDLGKQLCGTVTLTKDGEPPDELARRLEGQGINVSVTGAPYAVLDLGARGLDAVLRASVHYYNTDNEIDRFIEVIRG
ncbi:MAG TPA: aminotransferase class V-fold PLP-dependent enzyme [Woeseiaceae bacterium]|nr:aminotransferase class V-fold PLP-dependent enzyme [Woeseiaceae bacterium]